MHLSHQPKEADILDARTVSQNVYDVLSFLQLPSQILSHMYCFSLQLLFGSYPTQAVNSFGLRDMSSCRHLL